MAGRTREKSRQNKKRNHKRRAQTKKNQKPTPTPTPTPTPIIESHRFMSSMTFDGNTLTTQTQKDDEPVIRRRYTKEQLAREIPIGNEMVEQYLDGKMPKELQAHHHEHRRPVFRNVLISPADLGLLPPRELERPIAKMSRRRRQRRHHRLDNDDNDYNDDNDDNDDELEMVVNEHGKKKHIFDLP